MRDFTVVDDFVRRERESNPCMEVLQTPALTTSPPRHIKFALQINVAETFIFNNKFITSRRTIRNAALILPQPCLRLQM